MRIQTSLSERDFVHVTFVVFFAKPIMRILFAIMSLALILAVFSAVNPSTILGDFSVSRLVYPLVVVAFLPAVTYFAAKKNYAANKRIHEMIEYNFGNNYLTAKGESFNSEMTWDKIYKVSLTKKWLFIWQSKHSVNAIHKSDLPDGALSELKHILIAKGVENNIP